MCQNFCPLYGGVTLPGWTDSFLFISFFCADSLWLPLSSGCCECGWYKYWHAIVYLPLFCILLGFTEEWSSVSCVIPCLVCWGAHMLFFRVCAVLHGHQQWTNALISPPFFGQRLAFCITVTNIAMLMGVLWCRISFDLCFFRSMTRCCFSWAYCLFAWFLWRKLSSSILSMF